MVALFKNGDRTQCTNYCSISLLPCISNVFERVVFKNIFDFPKTLDLINPRQSGFLPGDSTINQLSALCHNISCKLDTGDEVKGVFLDLTKAFDRVWHKGLLLKLDAIGIRGKMHKLLTSYSCNRKQSY